MKITFLIPAYNEEATIRELLDRVWALDLDKQLVIVDDGSRDATARIVEEWATGRDGVDLIRKPNGGKGSALRAGIPHIRGDIVVIQDADLEYDPADVPALLDPILKGHADVVYGSRLSGGRLVCGPAQTRSDRTRARPDAQRHLGRADQRGCGGP